MAQDDRTTRLDDAETARLDPDRLDETQVAPGGAAGSRPVAPGQTASWDAARRPAAPSGFPAASEPETEYVPLRQARPAPAQQPYVPGARPTQPAPQTPRRRGRAGVVVAVVAGIVLVALIAFQLGTCSANAHRAGAAGTSAQTTTKPTSPTTHRSASARAAAEFDYGTLVGEKLSNAYALLKHAGIDTGGSDPSIAVVTSDGKQVVNAANWTVSEASYTEATNAMLLKVDHDGEGLGIDVDSAKSQLGDLVGRVGDAVSSGQLADGLRDLAGNLADGIDGLTGSGSGTAG